MPAVDSAPGAIWMLPPRTRSYLDGCQLASFFPSMRHFLKVASANFGTRGIDPVQLVQALSPMKAALGLAPRPGCFFVIRLVTSVIRTEVLVVVTSRRS